MSKCGKDTRIVKRMKIASAACPAESIFRARRASFLKNCESSTPVASTQYPVLIRSTRSVPESRDFGRRVCGFCDRAPYYDVRGSGGNRFGWSDDARLVVGSAARKAHPRASQWRSRGAKLLRQRGGFEAPKRPRLCIHSKAPGRPASGLDRALLRAGQSCPVRRHSRLVRTVTARTSKSGLAGLRGFDGSTQHLPASGGVHGQHAHAAAERLRGRPLRPCSDVVILEVEKDAAARTHQFTDRGRTFGSVEAACRPYTRGQSRRRPPRSSGRPRP